MQANINEINEFNKNSKYRSYGQKPKFVHIIIGNQKKKINEKITRKRVSIGLG